MLKKAGTTIYFILPLLFILTLAVVMISHQTARDSINLSSPDNKPPMQCIINAKLNINEADATQLKQLPYIGSEIADRIIAYRDENGPFRDLNDLLNVKGIGEITFGRILNYITIGD